MIKISQKSWKQRLPLKRNYIDNMNTRLDSIDEKMNELENKFKIMWSRIKFF